MVATSLESLIKESGVILSIQLQVLLRILKFRTPGAGVSLRWYQADTFNFVSRLPDSTGILYALLATGTKNVVLW